MEVERIDVNFDFTTDTPSYWDNWQIVKSSATLFRNKLKRR